MIRASIFRENDIRGITERDITPQFAELLGRAFSEFIRSKTPLPAASRPNITIGLGRDCRLSSEGLAQALERGLVAGGVDVVRLGVCPTPVGHFSVFHLNLDGAIMVTGSHNPADYNGFKMSVGRGTLHGHDVQAIRSIMERLQHEKPQPLRVGSIADHPIIPEYLDHLVRLMHNAGQGSKLKVVIDAGNGTAGNVAPQLLERLGATVIPLYCELDGRFPHHHPDPTVAANLVDLVAAVRREKADLGIGFDGDADRIGVVDETGRILYGDELMVLFSRAVLAANPGASIISEVKSSYRLFNDIAGRGGQPIMWKAGHSVLRAKMKETGALLAGEMSGHIFFADRYFGYDDAMYAATRLLEICQAAGRPLSTLLADLPPSVVTPEIRIDCDEDKKFHLAEETKRILARDARCRLTEIDGVRADFGDGWGLVRASNTQPMIVLRFEAPNESRLSEIRAIIEKALNQAAKIVGHAPINTDIATGAPH